MAYIKAFKTKNKNIYKGLYICQQKVTKNNLTNTVEMLICKVKTESFESEIITASSDVQNISSVVSIYIDKKHETLTRLKNIINGSNPQKVYTDENTTQSMWAINDTALIGAICEDFAPRKLKIIQGSDKYKSSLNTEDEYITMTLVDSKYENSDFLTCLNFEL